MSCITGHRKLRTAEQGPFVLFLFVVLWTDPTSNPIPTHPHTHPQLIHMLCIHTSIWEALCSLKISPHVFLFGGRTNTGFFSPPPLSQQLKSLTLRHTTVPRLLSVSCMFFSYLHKDDGKEVTLRLKREDMTLQA